MWNFLEAQCWLGFARWALGPLGSLEPLVLLSARRVVVADFVVQGL